MTNTSPGRSAPATSCSQKASIDPPAKAVAVPGTVPIPPPIGPTTGSCDWSTPSSASTSLSHRPLVYRSPKDMAVAMSMAGTPVRAWVAMAWQFQ